MPDILFHHVIWDQFIYLFFAFSLRHCWKRDSDCSRWVALMKKSTTANKLLGKSTFENQVFPSCWSQKCPLLMLHRTLQVHVVSWYSALFIYQAYGWLGRLFTWNFYSNWWKIIQQTVTISWIISVVVMWKLNTNTGEHFQSHFRYYIVEMHKKNLKADQKVSITGLIR